MSDAYGDEGDVFGQCEECIGLEDERDELRAEIDRQDALLRAGKESQERCAEASLADAMTIESQEAEIERLRVILADGCACDGGGVFVSGKCSGDACSHTQRNGDTCPVVRYCECRLGISMERDKLLDELGKSTRQARPNSPACPKNL